ncbi:MAG: hypothetical protein HN919_10135 [Verrucomicrobia bacterium]|jgi:hypothetical protein|nr:hypothetical protein [Verrucomicrobiota bacterium]MBT7066650.1 hypothetical protein [Verrucomicrobiota bacterium]MBT7700147.1 hypothetical protein [Verrucomicrobiota bacterium]
MKVTQYFLTTRTRSDRQSIEDMWIEATILNPDAVHIQHDGRIRKWKKIEAAGNRYLRVVLLEDGETVHNAFFDRRFQEKEI